MDKKSFRKICLERLKKRKVGNSYKLDKLVIAQLLKIIDEEKAKVIMLYIPLKIEVNIYSLIKNLRMEKKTVLVPFMEGESFSLVKYRLPLNVKQFSVKEPNNTNRYKRKVDLAIVPVIGVDRRMKRVGFGKGFYDRFFGKNCEKISKILFVSREYCFSSENITDDYDVKGSLYLTAKKSFLQRKSRI
jgi:5-formyltetrahydrofolate cyclo-ligase